MKLRRYEAPVTVALLLLAALVCFVAAYVEKGR